MQELCKFTSFFLFVLLRVLFGGCKVTPLRADRSSRLMTAADIVQQLFQTHLVIQTLNRPLKGPIIALFNVIIADNLEMGLKYV